MGNAIIEKVASHKDLGIIIDEEFKFKQHREDIVKRAHRKLGLIIRFGKHMANKPIGVQQNDTLRTYKLNDK